MLEKFYPYQRIGSVYDFDFRSLREQGIKGLVFDIDNTLVPDQAPANYEAEALINGLTNMGFSCLILSNNSDKRVLEFIRNMKCKYVLKARKPSSAGFLKAMEILGTDFGNTAFFGDQIFTDVYGANRAGVHMYLCKPIDRGSERTYIKLKRIAEAVILKSYNKHKMRNNVTNA